MGRKDNMSFDSDSDSGKCCSWACVKRILRKNLLVLFLLVGIIAGAAIGIGVRSTYPDFSEDKRNQMYIGFPGELFLRMLKCCIIPLIVTSLISSMAALTGKAARRLGGFAVLYYMITTVMAVLLGILLVLTIKPGSREVDDSVRVPKDKLLKPVDALLDLIRNCFPPNIVASCIEQTKTDYETEWRYTDVRVSADENGTLGNWTTKAKEVVVDFSTVTGGSTNVLGLVVFSIVLGLVVGNMEKAGLPVREFVDSLQLAVLKIVVLIIWLSPIGIASILAARIMKMDDPELIFKQLGWYIMTVLVGLGIHGFIILPLIYFIFTRKNPLRHIMHMSDALLTALGTASSSATLPITMRCLEENAGVDKRVSRFVLPVGATINMDGTALYEAVASIFIAQINHIDLDAGQVVTVCITATAAAIGAAGIPEAGLVTMVIVLTAVGLPTEDIGLIFAVDWFLDRFRTMVNVWGDSVGAGVVEKLSIKALDEMDEETQANGGVPTKHDGNINRAYVNGHRDDDDDEYISERF